MKNDKKPQMQELRLEPVRFEEPRHDLIKTMSLDDLLAALAMILEFEAVHKEIYSPHPPSKYLH